MPPNKHGQGLAIQGVEGVGDWGCSCTQWPVTGAQAEAAGRAVAGRAEIKGAANQRNQQARESWRTAAVERRCGM